MKYNHEIVELATEFIDSFLIKQKWFNRLSEKRAYDLIFVSGSTLTGKTDKYSDVDLFLVCSVENQKKFKLQPVYEYQYNGMQFEISMFSTEKLYRAAQIKDDVYRWSESVSVKSKDKEILVLLKKATSLNKSEKRERLWSNYVVTQINNFDIRKQVKRLDNVSCVMLINENIRMLFESILCDVDKYSSVKKMSSCIKKVDLQAYSKINLFYKSPTYKSILSLSKYITQRLQKMLLRYGFTKHEVDNWDKTNLHLVSFQKR